MGQRLPVWFFCIFSLSPCHWQWCSSHSWLCKGTQFVWWHPAVHGGFGTQLSLLSSPDLAALLTPAQAVFQCWTRSQGDEHSIWDQRLVSACCDTVRDSLWLFHYQCECSHPIWVVSKIKTPTGSISCQDFLWKMVLSEKSKGDGTSSKVFPSEYP